MIYANRTFKSFNNLLNLLNINLFDQLNIARVKNSKPLKEVCEAFSPAQRIEETSHNYKDKSNLAYSLQIPKGNNNKKESLNL